MRLWNFGAVYVRNVPEMFRNVPECAGICRNLPECSEKVVRKNVEKNFFFRNFRCLILVGLEPPIPGSVGKGDNHYTTQSCEN